MHNAARAHVSFIPTCVHPILSNVYFYMSETYEAVYQRGTYTTLNYTAVRIKQCINKKALYFTFANIRQSLS